MTTYVVDTDQSAWTGGVIHGLGDPLLAARIQGRTLAQWREGADRADGPVTGPALVVGADTFFSPILAQAFEGAAQGRDHAVQLARNPAGPGGLCDPLARLPKDDTGRILFDLWAVPAGVSFDATTAEGRAAARPLDVDLRTRALPLPSDPEVTGGSALTLQVCGGVCGPIGHWAELARMNLLCTAGQLMGASPGRAVLRYVWAAIRAGSFHPMRAGRKMNHIGRRCAIHPSAVVEFSVLGDDVRIGPGAVVRGCFLADGVQVGSQPLAELSTLDQGAEIQRQSMVNVSTIYPGARVGGVVQLGLCGERSAQKMFAVGTDMRLGGKVRTETPDGLREVDIGYLGVCFGHRSFVGSGVWIGPGRVVPADAKLVRPAEHMVLKPAAEITAQPSA